MRGTGKGGKAGRPRPKPPDLKGKTQYEKFIETAKAVDIPDDKKTLDDTVLAIIKPNKSRR